jgi:hypothetical protein
MALRVTTNCQILGTLISDGLHGEFNGTRTSCFTLLIPVVWISPAPSFMYAFSDLQVSNDRPIESNFESSELALTLDVSKTTAVRENEPAISVEDPSPIAHETQMQAKMQGAAVTGYPENVGYYPEQFAAPATTYTDPFAYSTLSGYELNAPSLDTTPTASNGTGVPYQYHQ